MRLFRMVRFAIAPGSYGSEFKFAFDNRKSKYSKKNSAAPVTLLKKAQNITRIIIFVYEAIRARIQYVSLE